VLFRSALIGMAAHLDGKAVAVLDMTGIAQKGGSVFSHVRLCDDPGALHAPRIATGEADALIGGDAIVSASPEALAKLRASRTRAAINTAATPTAELTANANWRFPLDAIRAALNETIGEEAVATLDATALATQLMGNAIYANLLLLGFAWQRGLVPVSETALLRAIELNGTAVTENLSAFRWGRCVAHDPASVPQPASTAVPPTQDLSGLIADRAQRLVDYQNTALADRYRAPIEALRNHPASDDALLAVVARNYYKLLAIKDEYEVARCYAAPAWSELLAAQFEGNVRLHFHFAPPLIAHPDPLTGKIAKRRYGPWMMFFLRWLAKAKPLRGTRWDPFARSPERALDRALLADYEADLALITARLDTAHLPAARALAGWPEAVRGFGPVRQESASVARRLRDEARAQFAH
jgi:indolepyruvate ferredoxin oxidoreductase